MLTEHIPLPDCEPWALHAIPYALGGYRWAFGYYGQEGDFFTVGLVGWHDRDAALDELRTRINVYRTLTS